MLYSVNFLSANVGVGGSTIDFSAVAQMGRCSIINNGTNDVYFAFDAVPVVGAPVPPSGTGVLKAGQAFNWENMTFARIGLITGAGSSLVTVSASESPSGNASGVI